MVDMKTTHVKMVFGTNIWSHYQGSIGAELAKVLGTKHFRMALFEPLHSERRKLGWEENRGDSPWIVGPPSTEQDKNRLYQICLDADVMVFGACPMDILKARVAANKLTLIASERLLKKPYHYLRMLNPRYALGIMQYRSLVNHRNVHALTIGHYASDDLRTIGAFGDRRWKWGYFAEVCPTPPVATPDRPIKLLWVGRMLEWKKVDTLLRAVARVQDSQNFGECNIVGDGPEKLQLSKIAHNLRLKEDRVHFLAPVHFNQVRGIMRESDVYVLPSNRHEGWGIVVGEAMSEGCVVVANEKAGASRDQIVNGETGFLYKDCDADHLSLIIESISKDYKLRMNIRQKAWKMVYSLWNPRVAAERLISLCDGLLGNSKIPIFYDGPCSKI